ncbi:MAG: 30S ribosome-binding factor RbfA [Mycobacteriales bacterium]
MSDPQRARRLATRIREIVATTLEMRVKDPRLGMVTITDVRLTGDLHDARVFYTVYGDDTAIADSAAALESACGVVRNEVGRQTGVRFTPTLTFVLDVVPDAARQIEELLEVARHADAQVAAVREGAAYAGDPDPYKPPRDDTGDADTTRSPGAEGRDTAV